MYRVLKYRAPYENSSYFMFLDTYETLLYSHCSRAFDEIITQGRQSDEVHCRLKKSKVIDKDHYDKYNTFYGSLNDAKKSCVDDALQIFYECIEEDFIE